MELVSIIEELLHIDVIYRRRSIHVVLLAIWLPILARLFLGLRGREPLFLANCVGFLDAMNGARAVGVRIIRITSGASARTSV